MQTGRIIQRIEVSICIQGNNSDNKVALDLLNNRGIVITSIT